MDGGASPALGAPRPPVRVGAARGGCGLPARGGTGPGRAGGAPPGPARGNVLQAAREPWLAIDPKPLVGEREFDTASLLRDRRPELLGDPGAAARVRRRLDQLAAELDLDRERMRGWGLAHALAWNGNQAMIACARLLAAAR
ncbi:MAG: aminoglycoside phosphotransferase family protein [Gaiellaceae bacterium]